MRNSKTHQRTLIALFEHRADAERAISRLIGSGIRPEHIGYLQPIDMGDERNGVKGAAEGIAAGATSGAVIGGLIAAAVTGPDPGVRPAMDAGDPRRGPGGGAHGGQVGS